MGLFHIFTCMAYRENGTVCGWPWRLGDRRARGPDGRRLEVAEGVCRRCRRQGRPARSMFVFVQSQTKDRRIVEDLLLAQMR